MINWNRKFPYIISCLNLLLIFPIWGPLPQSQSTGKNCWTVMGMNRIFFLYRTSQRWTLNGSRLHWCYVTDMWPCFLPSVSSYPEWKPPSYAASRHTLPMSRSVRVARTAIQRGSIKIPKESVMVFPDGGVIPPWLFLSWLNHPD